MIEDDEGYRAFIVSLVARLGFRVQSCGDGREALEILKEGGIFDLLIIDFELPFVSGLDLISSVRSDRRHQDSYCVMLTSREDGETRINAFRAGFDDFLSKGAGEAEITAKLSAARRIVSRQLSLDARIRELYGLATRDELTGLYNRRFFFGEAERVLAAGNTISLVLFDLDGFKRVNDTYGHMAGDRILRDIGSLFLNRTRHDDLIARYGGDEFIMLVTDLAPDDVAGLSFRLAADISVLQWTFASDTISIGVTTGVGSSVFLEEPTVAQILSASDRDLYKNKWIRKYPDRDPSLYEYDTKRAASLLDFPSLPADADKQVRGSDEESGS